MKKRPVLVTTAEKGVFFGYANDTKGTTIKLEQARLCVYWSSDMRGFMGLANMGPSNQCRVGPPVEIILHNVTSVSTVTPEAVVNWEKAPWGV